MENICTELRQSSGTKFDSELKDVIFSHVGEASRLQKDTLDELIGYQTGEAESRIRQITDDLAKVNVRIGELEERQSPEHKAQLVALLRTKEAELQAHDAAKPTEVLKPADDPTVQSAAQGITEQLAKIDTEAKELAATLEEHRAKDGVAASRVASADKLLGKIENLERYFVGFSADANPEATALNLRLEEIAKVEVNKGSVELAKQAATADRTSAGRAMDNSDPESTAGKLEARRKNADNLRASLDEPHRRFHDYLGKLAEWQERRSLIVGPAEKPDTIEGLKARIDALASLPMFDVEQACAA